MKNFMKGCLPSSFPKMLGGHSITCQAKPLKQGLYGTYDNNHCYSLYQTQPVKQHSDEHYEEGRRRGRQRMRRLDGITDSMDMSLSKLRSW